MTLVNRLAVTYLSLARHNLHGTITIFPQLLLAEALSPSLFQAPSARTEPALSVFRKI